MKIRLAFWTAAFLAVLNLHAPAATLQFTDIGANLTPVDGASVAWGDYDNDGHLDLLVSGSGTTYIYHNNGDGTFSLTASLLGINMGQAVWGDYNNDGRLDVLLNGFDSNGDLAWRIYRNDGSNTFTQVFGASYGNISLGGDTTRMASCAWADYDNDGRLDALFVGLYSALYHNNGNDSFTDSGISIPTPPWGDVAWGDYNNDGNLDFVVNGGGGTGMTALYKNLGNGLIVPATNVLTGVYRGSAAWGDFNNDGNLDLAVTGLNNNLGYLTRIYVGDGHGGFTNLPVNLDGTVDGTVAWGDFDNDGLPDLVISSDASTGTTKIYHNNGDGTFTDTGVSLPGCGNGGIAVGDFNNDGKLDLAIVGGGVAKIFRNDSNIPTNTPPSPPTNLRAVPITNAMRLSWSAATDANQNGGLSYNIRMGTTPGGIDVVGPMADPATGFRRIPAIGNAGLCLSRTVTHLHSGTYYWSVQAIDHNFAGSTFAPEQSFTIASPTLATQPASQTNAPGTPVSFQVAVDGTLPITYQWYFDGAPLADNGRITGSGTTNLAITSVQVPDAGEYTVVADNVAGSVTSRVATLTIPVAPVITTQPSDVSVPAGLSAAFSLSAAGTGPFTYQWQFGGTNLDGATNDTLSLTDIQMSQAGPYAVVVSNIYGGVVSSNAILTVVPSSVVIQPRSQPADGGATVSFSADVTGVGPFAYQWQFEATNLVDATNSALVLTNVQARQTGAYAVVVSNSFGVVTSSNALLTVTPWARVQPPVQLASVGATVMFTAVEGGLDTGANFQWQFMGTNLPDATTNPLALTNVQMNQAGVYDVIVSNAFGAATSSNGILSLNQIVVWGDGTYGQTNIPADVTNVTAIAAGNTFILAIRSDGTVTGWGSDTDGETDVPVGLSNVVAVAGGNNFSVALKSDGTVVAWGDNTYGATNVPADLSNVVAIACANEHVLALRKDGTVVSWGYYPLVGPASAPAGISNVVSVSAGGYTGLALKNNGTVTGWGPAANGELNFPDSLTNVAEIAGGGDHCVAVRRDGTVLAWGFNGYGQTTVPAELTNGVAVAAGNDFSMALTGDGTVAAWGDNSSGQTNVPPSLTNVIAIAAGASFGVALLNDGAPTVTEQPFVQQGYTGQTISLYATVAGAPPLSYQWQFDGTNIAGATNALLVLSNAQLASSGDYRFIVSNTFGSVTSSNVLLSVSASPPFILGQPAQQFSFIFSNVTLRVNANGSWPLAYQWQFNGTKLVGATNASLTLTNLQLSDAGDYDVTVTNAYGAITNSNTLLSISPVVIWGSPSNQPPGLTNVLSIAGYPAALRRDGTVVWWNGSLSSPIAVYGLSNAIAISGSLNYASAALLSNGNVQLWNSDGTFRLNSPGSSNAAAISADNYGDLELRPNGTLVGSALSGAPLNVINLSNAVAIAEGLQHSLALKADGTVVAWGNNNYGQATVPSKLSNVVAIAAGGYHSLALKNNGTVTAWGANFDQQTNVPPGLSNVVAIAAGGYHSLALKNNGTVVAWGWNNYGQTNVPPGLSNVVAIAAGQYDSLALVGNGPPVLQALLTHPVVGTNGFNLTLPTQSGRVYVLEYKNTLKGTNWMALPLVAGDGTNLVLSDTSATNAQRFYRVLRW